MSKTRIRLPDEAVISDSQKLGPRGIYDMLNHPAKNVFDRQENQRIGVSAVDGENVALAKQQESLVADFEFVASV